MPTVWDIMTFVRYLILPVSRFWIAELFTESPVSLSFVGNIFSRNVTGVWFASAHWPLILWSFYYSLCDISVLFWWATFRDCFDGA